MAHPTVQARLAALAQAMLGAIGPISPPNDVRGQRVQLWIEQLTAISVALTAEQAGLDVPDVVGEIADLRAQLAGVVAERDALLVADPSRRARTEPAMALQEPGTPERWAPTRPKARRPPPPPLPPREEP